MSRRVAIVLAAGRGSRLGADKALVDLGGRTAIERIVTVALNAGFDRVVVVRQVGAKSLGAQPDGVEVIAVESDQMFASLRGALDGFAERPDELLIWPVDYPLVDTEVILALRSRFDEVSRSDAIVLPLCSERPGHPLLVGSRISEEIGSLIADSATADSATADSATADSATMRDVIRRDASRVYVARTESAWVLRDLDHPADLAAARGYLSRANRPVTELMRAHRSHRGFRAEPVGDAQLRWLVDSARYASTSSYSQAYSVVTVADPDRKAAVARLCADQPHIHAAPIFLAICADLHRIDLACGLHGADLRSDSLESFVTATVDAALFGQNLLLAAESEGLGGCMLGAARNHPVELAELLGLPSHVYVVFGMVLGWPADDPLPRGRLPLDAVLHRERYDSSRLTTCLQNADDAVRDWAVRSNEHLQRGQRRINETRGWTDRMKHLWSSSNPSKSRNGLREALRTLGFDAR